jgi:hypothetical protein
MGVLEANVSNIPAADTGVAEDALTDAAMGVIRTWPLEWAALGAHAIDATRSAAASRFIGAGSARSPALHTCALDAAFRTTITICGAGLPVGEAGHGLDAGRRCGVTREPITAFVIRMACLRVRALGAGGASAQRKRGEAAREHLQYAAARGAGADQSGEVVEALAVHSPACSLVAQSGLILRILEANS